MDKAFNFIKKSNQVLFFLVVILFIVLISKDFISELLRNDYEPPKIELVDSSDPNDKVKKPVYTVNYLALLEDVHIFELSSKVIDINKEHEVEAFGMFGASTASYDVSGGLYLSDNAVNLMFVKENEKQRMLLEKDGLVKEFSKAKFVSNERAHRLDKNLYLIIDEDTNENGFLDHKDSAKLFTSTYDGNNLTIVLSDVESFRLIDDNKLIISKKGDSPNFFTFDVTESKLQSLNTAITVPNEKI